MPNHFLRIAAVIGALSGLAACDRVQPARAASDLYPSATPAPVESTAAAPRSAALSREALSETMITGRIKAAILADPGMGGADVSVNTDSGVVSLTGTVKSQEQAAIASAHAQRHDGVMRIDNHLSTLSQ
jgi:hyperosmotically inducible protein